MPTVTKFRAWSEAVGDVRDRVRSEQGLGELFGYGQQLVARKRKQPGEDFISRLCADDFGDDEIAMLSMALLFAGHETRWWRSAWAPCACWPIPASSRLSSMIRS